MREERPLKDDDDDDEDDALVNKRANMDSKVRRFERKKSDTACSGAGNEEMPTAVAAIAVCNECIHAGKNIDDVRSSNAEATDDEENSGSDADDELYDGDELDDDDDWFRIDDKAKAGSDGGQKDETRCRLRDERPDADDDEDKDEDEDNNDDGADVVSLS
jgi:hypothetical protein